MYFFYRYLLYYIEAGEDLPEGEIIAGVCPVHRKVATLQLVAGRLIALQISYEDIPDSSHVVGCWLSHGLTRTGMSLKIFFCYNLNL